jgi:hypothetical protein
MELSAYHLYTEGSRNIEHQMLDQLFGCLVGWFVRSLVDWFVCLFVGWLVDWLVGQLIGWLVGRFVSDLVS